eukprot:TRINITY_DN33107_c0_g1_i1.p1 TRINITY_DN33107_c0_g1~~TRINITY_DN33107_c0_g1_i1.p1  ORF type:complete len:205 (+),score=44.37 TRINITY_DN33107_c0_g1_i1:32-616(+)
MPAEPVRHVLALSMKRLEGAKLCITGVKDINSAKFQVILEERDDSSTVLNMWTGFAEALGCQQDLNLMEARLESAAGIIKCGPDFFLSSWGQKPAIELFTKLPDIYVGVQDVRNVFETADANGDGSLTRDELKNILVEIGMGYSFQDRELDLLFSSVDVNRDGRLNCREFVDWCFGTNMISEEEKALAGNLIKA